MPSKGDLLTIGVQEVYSRKWSWSLLRFKGLWDFSVVCLSVPNFCIKKAFTPKETD